jgi:predicted transcriptional regulator of viral defense system
VCLLSALAFYGLTDAIPRAVWLLVPAEKHTRFSGVRLLRKRTPRLEVGIIVKDGYKITSLERTLAESLAEGKRIGVNTGVQALRKALSQKKTKLGKVMDCAIELGIAEKISPYLEALS